MHLSALRLPESLRGQPLPERPRLRVLVTTVSSDSHTWNLVFLQLLLEYMGHTVINLGACPPDEMVIEACRQHEPDLLVVSSINGHGNIDGERLIKKIRGHGDLVALPAVIGGKLGVGTDTDREFLAALRAAGFDAVFDAASSMVLFEKYVRQLCSIPVTLRLGDPVA